MPDHLLKSNHMEGKSERTKTEINSGGFRLEIEDTWDVNADPKSLEIQTTPPSGLHGASMGVILLEERVYARKTANRGLPALRSVDRALFHSKVPWENLFSLLGTHLIFQTDSFSAAGAQPHPNRDPLSQTPTSIHVS